MNAICFVVLAVLFINMLISFFIKYYKINYYRKRYNKRDVQEFILKFCHGCFCFSTYNPDPEMAYNVYGENPMTKKELQIWLNKLEYDGIIRRSYYNKEKTCTIISERKAKLLKEIYRS